MNEIPLSFPDVTDREIAAVTEVLVSGRLSLGPFLERFEKAFAERTGSRYAVAVSSGTAALHLILRAVGIEEGDEVITTPFSFVASSNAVLFERAKPVFVDIDAATLNLNPALVEAAVTERTKAILGVDVFGLPADWLTLQRIADDNGLLTVDDACEALGARIGRRKIGSVAHASAFGFYPNKQITTGEGGCVTTDSEEIASACRSMRNQGRSQQDRMNHVLLGYNYRLSELSAALGCAQLERFDDLSERRGQIAAWYREALAELRGDIALPPEPAGIDRSWFVYVVQLKRGKQPETRDALIASMADDGIQTAPYFPTIHLQPLYRDRFGYRRGTFPVAESIADTSIALPFFTAMTPDHVKRVADSLRRFLRRHSSTVSTAEAAS